MAYNGAATETPLQEIDPSATPSTGTEWPVLLEFASPTPDRERLVKLLRGPLDWNSLLTLAKEHGILALVARSLEDCGEFNVPPQVLQNLQEWHRARAFSTLNMTGELFRLLEKFAASGVETLVIKGPALSVRCYGDPGFREYGDLDLIVRDKDIRRSTELMVALGYQPIVPLQAIEAGKIPGEYVFLRPEATLRIEFHTEHTFRYYLRPCRMNDLFGRQARVQFDAHDVPALSLEDELILISSHGAKHFWERLMWIADVAALASPAPRFDWKRATLLAREVGAERMLNLALRLASDLLHAPLPEEIAAAVNSDAGARRLAVQIERWLPAAGASPPGLLERARFRTRLCIGTLAGVSYLVRLSLSSTEEDWIEGAGHKSQRLAETLRRPFRLARKYRADVKPKSLGEN